MHRKRRAQVRVRAHLWQQQVEQRPQLPQVVLQRRARQQQAAVRLAGGGGGG